MALEDIFRAYDIRGRTDDELTEDVMEDIGKAFATELDRDTVVIGHDVRDTSKDLADAFTMGVISTGTDVHWTGMVPYGTVLFAGWKHALPSAYITASHLAPEWNGVKFAHGNGIGYTEEENMAVRDRFFDGRFDSGSSGTVTELPQPLSEYGGHLLTQIDMRDIDVLMDCGNGASGVIAPDLFDSAGADTTVMFEEPDGSFPNRESDVSKSSLGTLQDRMAEEDHDVGIAYDGDADRVAVVDDHGKVLDAEQVAAVLLDHVCEIDGGPVVANVECSRLLEHVADQHDREVKRVRVGHTYLFQAIQKHDACLGVEKSRHMGIPHVLPLDDGIAASLYVASVVSQLDQPLSDVVADLPMYSRSRSSFTVADQDKFEVVRRLQDRWVQEYDNVNMTDGARVDLDEGWVLVRASNTSPKVRVTIESESSDAFRRFQHQFRDTVRNVIHEVEDERNEAVSDQTGTDEDTAQ